MILQEVRRFGQCDDKLDVAGSVIYGTNLKYSIAILALLVLRLLMRTNFTVAELNCP
jgi:hypothetical protein